MHKCNGLLYNGFWFNLTPDESKGGGRYVWDNHERDEDSDNSVEGWHADGTSPVLEAFLFDSPIGMAAQCETLAAIIMDMDNAMKPESALILSGIGGEAGDEPPTTVS